MTPATAAAQLVAPQPTARILLVDDEKGILRAIQRILRSGGWEIHTAENGEQALAMLEPLQPQVVISDFRMPGMDGTELLAQVKARYPKIQRILLTGFADQSALEGAINRSEVFRYISKPWDDTQLMMTVRNAVEQFDLTAENEQLQEREHQRAKELASLNLELEQRVEQRTKLLARATSEWRLTFDSLDQPVGIVQEDYRLRRANKAYARLAGRAIQEVVERPACHQYLFGRSEPCPGCPLPASLTARESRSAEVTENQRTYVTSCYPMPEEAQAVCTYRDVTDERQLTARMVETEKMAAVGQLAGGVAHEINNPLGGVLAFTQMMKRESGRSQADLDSLGLIEESALRCKRIVESLLKFSRRSRASDRRLFPLEQCLKETALLFNAQLKMAPLASLEVAIPIDLPMIDGDPGQLSQVLLNLLQNGLHALGGQQGKLRLAAAAGPSGCSITVEDSGCGIAPEHLPHIFEPHFTTKPPGEGTGLGLSIAWGIVADHGGSIDVRSQPGAGSIFTVHLPHCIQATENA